MRNARGGGKELTDGRKVLITGAAGYIGSFVRKAWRDRYDLVLLDNKTIKDPGNADVFEGDITDPEIVKRACEGVDTVLHLAAIPNMRATFDQLLAPNIIGAHNVFQAAVDAGARRIVFSSSIHAVGGYLPETQVKWDMPVRPCCEYGASKCYAESLLRMLSDYRGISAIVIRVGGVYDSDDESDWRLSKPSILVSERDITQLITRCVDAPDDIRFAIVHGLSNNRIKRLDITHTRELLGYEPEDEPGAGREAQAPQPLHGW